MLVEGLLGVRVVGAGVVVLVVRHNDIVGVVGVARDTSPIAQHVTCITLAVSVAHNTRKRATIVSYSGAYWACYATTTGRLANAV